MKLSLINVAYIFSSVLSQEICYLPLDVMFLQDTTGSFDDDLPNVLKQIPEMVQTITNDFPESQFGVAEFKDKPYFPLGEPDDFCYKLGDGKLSPQLDDFEWAYSLLYASGGGDLPEASFQALINIALDPLVGWRPLVSGGLKASNGQAGARLVIMSTDAQPHLPLDIEKLNPVQFPDVPRGLPANSGSISTGDVDYECFFQDYPSADQIKSALSQMKIYLVILTPEDPEIVPAWKWVNEVLLEQPSSFYQFISADSSDLLSGVLKAVEAVTQHACPTTTTPEPTTTTTTETTTTAATTTEATTTTIAPTTPTGTESVTLTTAVPATTSAASTLITDTTVAPTIAPTEASDSTGDETVSQVGTTEASTQPITASSTSEEICPPCPNPCPQPCPTPCCCHCEPTCQEALCNEGVLIVISDKPKHVNITLA